MSGGSREDEFTIDRVDPIFPPPSFAPSRLTEEQKQSFRSQMKSTSDTISINCWLVIVLSFASILVLSVVISVSAKVSAERKIIIGTIVGSVLLIIQMILCISRKEPNMLITFSTIGAYLSGVALGWSVGYI